jgi:hypothetical protein
MNVTLVSHFSKRYPVGLEFSYARAFEKLEHTVRTVSLAEHFVASPLLQRVSSLVAPTLGQAAACREVLASGAEVVVLIKAAGLWGSTVRTFRGAGMRVVNVFPDNPFDIMGLNVVGRTLLDQFRALDMVFVHDRYAVGQLAQLGIRSSFLAFARDPLLHDPADATEPLPDQPDVVFIGNPDSERIRYLRAITDLGLGLWAQWDWARLGREDPLYRCVRGKELFGRDMVRAMRYAKISINLLRRSQKTAHNMRSFESPASRACTLSEASPGVLELFEDGREVLTFSTPEDLRRKVLSLLESSAMREQLAGAGWDRVREDDYSVRAAELLARLDDTI